ncbi:hypothetical protein ES703_92851 [subsurface metagenome]
MNEDLSEARDNFIEGAGYLASTVGLTKVMG